MKMLGCDFCDAATKDASKWTTLNVTTQLDFGEHRSPMGPIYNDKVLHICPLHGDLKFSGIQKAAWGQP